MRPASLTVTDLLVRAFAALFLAGTAALAAVWLWPLALELLAREPIADHGGHIAEPLAWPAGVALAMAPFAPAAAAAAQLSLALRPVEGGAGCPVCGTAHRNLAALVRHLDRRHQMTLKELVEPGLACPDCRRSFRDVDALAQHRRDRHHPIG